MKMNTIESTVVENRNKEHQVNLGGCKAMNDEYNGQEGIGTTLVETDARLDKMKRTYQRT